jgi:hypothetical protein
VVEVKRDASTVLAMRAAFVDSDAGNLYLRLTDWLKIDKEVKLNAYFALTPPP